MKMPRNATERLIEAILPPPAKEGRMQYYMPVAEITARLRLRIGDMTPSRRSLNNMLRAMMDAGIVARVEVPYRPNRSQFAYARTRRDKQMPLPYEGRNTPDDY